MALPAQLKAKYAERLTVLIQEGMAVVAKLQQIYSAGRNGIPSSFTDDYVEWATKCASVLYQIVPKQHPQYPLIRYFGNDDDCIRRYDCIRRSTREMAFMKAILDDFSNDFLENLADKIEAEIAADYMGQAEQLLKEGQTGKYDHVPAAVLIGAVLEKSLRTLCGRQTPKIETSKPDGRPLTLDPLIVALKKADVIKQTMAAQLSAWAHIRNKAAHGEFNQFTRQDVETMVSGVQNFIALHL